MTDDAHNRPSNIDLFKHPSGPADCRVSLETSVCRRMAFPNQGTDCPARGMASAAATLYDVAEPFGGGCGIGWPLCAVSLDMF